MDGAPPTSDDDDIDAATSLMSVYRTCVEKFGWNLRDIDETDLDTLFEFLVFRAKPDHNVRIIDGREYHRAKDTPSWL